MSLLVEHFDVFWSKLIGDNDRSRPSITRPAREFGISLLTRIRFSLPLDVAVLTVVPANKFNRLQFDAFQYETQSLSGNRIRELLARVLCLP